ncbi:hypothetical protein GJ744_009106 [Endocarpon pusillum]|uniref:Uncharacterized protein n=1 Tax=Endocarpon pusillum TaxID=364733 RepID=A0A8H7E405_9EURO|nr:hypothetical protein GJ744_009106 [Endocarpon pusillum]
MQAAPLEVHEEGSRFGNTHAFHSQAFHGNFHGLTINPTAACQAPVPVFQGQYVYSSLRPTANYVHRPQLHKEIREQLHDRKDENGEDVQVLTVWGLDYKAVFWIEAGSKETTERDYIQIYGLYGRPTRACPETPPLEDAVPAVKRCFQGQEGRWLVVLDSADTIDNEQDQAYIDLAYFLPDAPGVHVIITSRSSTAQEMTGLEGVAVVEMEPLEAIEPF